MQERVPPGRGSWDERQLGGEATPGCHCQLLCQLGWAHSVHARCARPSPSCRRPRLRANPCPPLAPCARHAQRGAVPGLAQPV